MTMEQLQFELRFLKINTDAQTQAELVTAIRNHLIPSLCREFTDTVNNATNTSSTFSCLVDEANKLIGKLRERTPPSHGRRPGRSTHHIDSFSFSYSSDHSNCTRG